MGRALAASTIRVAAASLAAARPAHGIDRRPGIRVCLAPCAPPTFALPTGSLRETVGRRNTSIAPGLRTMVAAALARPIGR